MAGGRSCPWRGNVVLGQLAGSEVPRGGLAFAEALESANAPLLAPFAAWFFSSVQAAAVLLGATPLAKQVVAPLAAGPQGDCPGAVMVPPTRFAVGVEGLVNALEAARGAPWRVDNAGRAEFVPSICRPCVVREEVVGAKSHAAMSHGTPGMDQSGASDSVGA